MLFSGGEKIVWAINLVSLGCSWYHLYLFHCHQHLPRTRIPIVLQIKANTLEMVRKMHEPFLNILQLRKSDIDTEREQKTAGERWSLRHAVALDLWLHNGHEVI